MFRVDDLYVALDGSASGERALLAAVPLARHWNARLTLVTVETPDDSADEAYLKEVAAGIEHPRIHTQVVPCGEGGVAATLAALAGADPASLMCLSSHGWGGPGRRGLGSVAAGVICADHVPALVVGRSCVLHWLGSDGPVIVCVDADHVDVEDPGLRRAISWSKLFGDELELISISDPAASPPADGSRARLEHLADHFRARGAAVRVRAALSAHPPAAVLTEALHRRPPLVIVGPRRATGRSSITDVLQPLLAGAPCPVLVVPELAAGDEVSRPGTIGDRRAIHR
jgi:nucleotide-binding universal stress UspA family protein